MTSTPGSQPHSDLTELGDPGARQGMEVRTWPGDLGQVPVNPCEPVSLSVKWVGRI